jgi:hypothetical protein|tara:strand:- start:15815 stop:16846 length:1032 start_codon:yes stop_codon:yes gene_type:complete
MSKEKINIGNHLSETATLVRFTTKFWSGIKSDKFLEKKLVESTNCDKGSVNAQKYLVGKEYAKHFRSIINQVRNEYYYPLTLAWDDNTHDNDGKVVSGWRLCPNRNLDKLVYELDKAEINFKKEVRGFIKDYPTLISEAKQKLGEAFNIEDYPQPEKLVTYYTDNEGKERMRGKFRFDVKFNEIPNWAEHKSKDVRLNISSSVINRIKNDVESRVLVNRNNSMKTYLKDIEKKAYDLAERLANYDPKDKKNRSFFKNQGINTLRGIVQVLPSMNEDVFGNDETINEIHQKLVVALAGIGNPEELREDSATAKEKRANISTKLKKAVDPINQGFMDQLAGGGND